MTETRAPGDVPPSNPAPENPAAGTPRKAPAGSGRDERLAAALRANLGRRKAQGRARAAEAADDTQARAAANAADGSQEE